MRVAGLVVFEAIESGRQPRPDDPIQQFKRDAPCSRAREVEEEQECAESSGQMHRGAQYQGCSHASPLPCLTTLLHELHPPTHKFCLARYTDWRRYYLLASRTRGLGEGGLG
eukprot:scaffold6871_cov29-Tisochrysis_lutea.AAC.4